jgi:mannose-1-phosphate guanylyltransferase
VQAVVLVGGFGTRLRPLTLRVPKQLLPVGHVPMIERVVGHLGRSGVSEVVLSLGYQPDAFLDEYPDGTCAGVQMRYAVEPEPLDTAGAIAFAAREAGINDRFVAVNGDVLTSLDLAAVWRSHEERGAAATIALTPVEDPSRYGVVPLDGAGRVEAFIEKPDPGTAPSNWINAGTYVLEPEVLERVPDGARVSIEREVFPQLVAEGSVYGVQSDAYWIDAGTPEAYLQVHQDLLAGRAGEHAAAVAADAAVDSTATVVDSFVGAGSTLAGGALVRGSVLMDGVRVHEGATVVDSVVAAGAVVGAGAVLEGGTVVGYGEAVADGTVASAGRFPGPESWESV